MSTSTLIIIIHDSVNNSVFAGQILAPALRALDTQEYAQIIIISFEKKITQQLYTTIPKRPDLQLILIHHALPFFGTISLLPAAYALRTHLRNYSHAHIQARGPIAGWIAARARINAQMPLTIQARGLLAAEHAYTQRMQSHTILYRVIQTIRTQLYASLEKSIYRTQQKNIFIQAVSPALGEHLVTQYHANTQQITYATQDIPEKIDTTLVHTWRTEYRMRLGITLDARVYCYNGSAKTWQRPDLIFAFFEEKIRENKNNVLLLLTTDQAEFAPHIQRSNFPHAIIMHTAPHAEIYQYLAAADVGILFRDAHIVNWVSRPTKMLEYEAIGLKIVHNNTVAWLIEKRNIKNRSKR